MNTEIWIILSAKENIEPQDIRSKRHLTFGCFVGLPTFQKIADVLSRGMFSYGGQTISSLTKEELKITNDLLRDKKGFCFKTKENYILVKQEFGIDYKLR